MTATRHGQVHGGNHLEYNTFGYMLRILYHRICWSKIPFESLWIPLNRFDTFCISNDSILRLALKANDMIASRWKICVSGPSLNNKVPGTKVPERHLLELDLFTLLHHKCLDESEANVTLLLFCYPATLDPVRINPSWSIMPHLLLRWICRKSLLEAAVLGCT